MSYSSERVPSLLLERERELIHLIYNAELAFFLRPSGNGMCCVCVYIGDSKEQYKRIEIRHRKFSVW